MSANCRASSRPMPLEAPVTTAKDPSVMPPRFPRPGARNAAPSVRFAHPAGGRGKACAHSSPKRPAGSRSRSRRARRARAVKAGSTGGWRSRVSGTRRRHRQRPERARRRDHPGRGRARGDRARGGGPRRRCRGDRRAHAPRVPPRHVLRRLPRGRRLARVRALAARGPRAPLGAPPLLLRASAPRRHGGGARARRSARPRPRSTPPRRATGRPGATSCSRISTASAHGATRCSAASRPSRAPPSWRRPSARRPRSNGCGCC